MKALSEETAKYLKPCPLADNDHCNLSVDDNGEWFTALFFRKNPYDGSLTDPSWKVSNWAREFPENTYLQASAGGMKIKLPATDMFVERFHATWKDREVYKDPATDAVYRNILYRGVFQDINANRYSDFKVSEKVEKHQYTLHEDFPLRKHQQVAMCNGIRSIGYGLFKEQGTGKTPATIGIVCNSITEDAKKHIDETGQMYRVIIVCPKNVRQNWVSEFEKFQTIDGKCTVIAGTKIERIQQVAAAVHPEPGKYFTVMIYSYEGMANSFKNLKEEEDLPTLPFDSVQDIVGKSGGYDLAVLDESHYIRNPRTSRAQAAMQLRDISKKRLCLTGTPIVNSFLDLYTQFEFMGKGYSGFMTQKGFRTFFGRYEEDFTNQVKLVGIQNIPFFQERLSRLTFEVKKEEVLKDLPSKVYNVIETTMTKEQIEMYSKIATQLEIEAEAEMAQATDGTRSMVVNNILTRMLKLAQVTSGFVVFPEETDDEGNVLQQKRIDRFDPSPKLETLIEQLRAYKESDPNAKHIVWTCDVPNIKTIAARCRLEFGDESCVTFYGETTDNNREIAKERFNCDPKCWIFIGNPAAGSTGLNLLGYPPSGHKIYKETGKTPKDFLTNCEHEWYFSQNWSPVTRWQSEDRAHRDGTRKQVNIHDIVVPNTIDVQIRKRVTAKKKHAATIQDVRDVLNMIKDISTTKLVTGD